jgi:hypothetical protein
MKKMNNYEAPKAEVIELNMNNDVMQTIGTLPTVGGSSETSL